MLFFDLDGTLIDSSTGIIRCIACALEKMGHPGLPPQELLGWIGPALRVSFGHLFDDPATHGRRQCETRAAGTAHHRFIAVRRDVRRRGRRQRRWRQPQ